MQRDNFVRHAEAYAGCRKGDARHRQIIDTCNAVSPRPYGKMGYTSPWCAAFVSAIAWATQVPGFPYAISCKAMIAYAIRKGIWIENDFYTPRPGELILYYWGDGKDYAGTDCRRDPNHVGIVTRVDGLIITVIEGNKGSASECGYRRLQVNGRYIRGFVRTRFADEAPAGRLQTSLPQVSKTLRKGSRGAQVKYLQMRLNAAGYLLDVDGDFGPKTEAALKDYQKKRGLEVDGVCGPKTRAAINS